MAAVEPTQQEVPVVQAGTEQAVGRGCLKGDQQGKGWAAGEVHSCSCARHV